MQTLPIVAAARLREADEYYAGLQQNQPNQDARLVQRQAFAGMIWSKQFYNYEVRTWLNGRSGAASTARGARQRAQLGLEAFQ